MNLADQRYLKPWLKELSKLKPEQVWREFISSNELPAMVFSNAVSAVYSANIEGNPIDINSYLASKFRGRTTQFNISPLDGARKVRDLPHIGRQSRNLNLRPANRSS